MANFRRGLVVFLVIAMSFIVSRHAHAAKPIVWKMQCAYPVQTSVSMHGREWVKAIEKMSNGRLKCEILPPGAMCAVGDIVTYLQKGVFDCSITYGGFYVGQIPEADLEIGLPKGFQTWYEFWDATIIKGTGMYREAYAELKFYTIPVRQLLLKLCNELPIHKLADSSGRKIRALGIY
jgi:TRAP-type C4-dicarboxylate transport system substrate-binding protein